jgi:xylose dehydrogenase (NAD/NADP)
MTKKLRWGVVSTANIGRVAVNPAIHASSNGELVAVASRNDGAAAAFAEAAGIPRHYGTYQGLLDDEAVDALYVPLPNGLHREWVIRAAEAGKHVLCEKPLAVTAADCREMERAAEANGVKLMEAFMYRFHPQTERVLELIAQGAVGDLRSIRSTFSFRLTRPDDIRWSAELGGGALMDVGCYCVNVSRTMAGAEPVEVQAWAVWGPSGVDEQLAGTLRFDNGVLAQFDCSLTMDRHETYEVCGTQGGLRVPAAFLPGTGDASIHEWHGNETTVHTVAGADEYVLMVEHFADCALHDRSPRYSAAEATLNMRVIEALLRSAHDDGAPTRVAGQ